MSAFEHSPARAASCCWGPWGKSSELTNVCVLSSFKTIKAQQPLGWCDDTRYWWLWMDLNFLWHRWKDPCFHLWSHYPQASGAVEPQLWNLPKWKRQQVVAAVWNWGMHFDPFACGSQHRAPQVLWITPIVCDIGVGHYHSQQCHAKQKPAKPSMVFWAKTCNTWPLEGVTPPQSAFGTRPAKLAKKKSVHKTSTLVMCFGTLVTFIAA